ncbi:MAG TPA: SDR family NAD(P)-dependent oxidoreductase [Candidatus Dormibacteraeota bacterium]|nr:SDR family NAD(P)-dependent oxidoreductase [Candidatus Dormibacteraeota bacterium]
MGRLDGMTALVTGGGRGIGRAVALAFAAEGARVAVAARTSAEIEAVAAECGGGAIAIPLDVTDEAACGAAVAVVKERMGGLQLLVHNAGIATSHKFIDLDTASWRRVMAVDLDGPFFLTRAALPLLLEGGEGAVIAIASVAARVGMPYVAAYTAAKHGLLGLMRALAAENVRRGITFNCVCPGYVDTPMTEQSVANIMARTGRSREQALEPLLTPQGRLVTPEEVAAVCLLLASREGRGITGQALNVDGGFFQG